MSSTSSQTGCHLYAFKSNYKTTAILIAAAFADETVTLEPSFDYGRLSQTPEFQRMSPLKKVRALMLGPCLSRLTLMAARDGCPLVSQLYDGWSLVSQLQVPVLVTSLGEPIFGASSIAWYFGTLGNSLVPTRPYQQALTQQYVSLANQDMYAAITSWTYPVLGYLEYSPEILARTQAAAWVQLNYLNDVLKERTFLCTDSVTLADVVIFCLLQHVYEKFLDATDRGKLVNLTAWMERCSHLPQVAGAVGKLEFCNVPIKHDPHRYKTLQPKIQNYLKSH
eukprot:m.26155 g.26155  ORF g.26155 m.26155 type:complete len:280 (-) comp11664_c0_seq2:79-918(-)